MGTVTAELGQRGREANSEKCRAGRMDWIEEVAFLSSFGLDYTEVMERFGLKSDAFWRRLQRSIEMDDCAEARRLHAKFKRQADEAREERAQEIRRRQRDERLGFR